MTPVPTGPTAPAQPSAPLRDLKDDEQAPPVELAEVIEEEKVEGKENEFAYTLRDRLYGEFKVLNTANGWWLDSQKVRDLLQAYKIDCTDEEACAYAGISYGQLRYFMEHHSEFLRVKTGCKQYPTLAARKRVVEAIGHSTSTATWYLERKKKDEFSTRSEIAGPNGADILNETAKLDQLIKDVRTATTKPATDEPSPAPTGPAGATEAGAPTADGASASGPTGPTAPASPAEDPTGAGVHTGAEATTA